MGVIDGAHGYMSKESQMYTMKDAMEDILRKKYVANYTKQQFISDYCEIAKILGYNPFDVRTWPKTTIFHLLNIKLDKGDASMKEEIYRMRTRR